MKQKSYNSRIISFLLVLLLCTPLLTIHAQPTLFQKFKEPENKAQSLIEYTDITVEEAWNLLTNLTNGIQIPIDVRTDNEWAYEHIDTDNPENPIHFPLSELQNNEKLSTFIDTYSGSTLIVYCKSGMRSKSAAELLCNSNFTGIIYNMLGGITAWKDAGYPTIANTAPSNPIITGPSKGKITQKHEFSIESIDPENDDIYYVINWSDGSEEYQTGFYPSNTSIIVNHSWENMGIYEIKVKSVDYYGSESEWQTMKISMPKKTDFLMIIHKYIDLFFPLFSN